MMVVLLGTERCCSQTWQRLQQTGQRGSEQDCSAWYGEVQSCDDDAPLGTKWCNLAMTMLRLVRSGVLNTLGVHLPYFCDFHG